MNIILRKHLTNNVYCRIKRKYISPLTNALGWDNATKIDKQKEGIVFYFGNNEVKQVFSFNFEDNCKIMNKIMKKLFDYKGGF